jgi:selenocysteine lyase/cysteine desulfurase
MENLQFLQFLYTGLRNPLSEEIAMNRREFVAAGVCGSIGAASMASGADAAPEDLDEPITDRDLFPRVKNQTYLNAAGLCPLGRFAERGMQRYLDYIRLGPGDGRTAYVEEARLGASRLYAELIGADEEEIGYCYCTKAGEQIAIDGLDGLRDGGNVVTNDMHFNGSLHNYTGLQKSGVDVRIVRSKDWEVSIEDMAAVIDDRTALVAVSLISNVNGRIEPVKELAEIAHAHGAIVYADIIQAAGIIPIDIHDLGVDVAAASGYKWLCGVYGCGFLYVRRGAQGGLLTDRMFPGRTTPNYEPWVTASDPSIEAFPFTPPTSATRYQAGHVNYMGYCAQYEGLRFVRDRGVPNLLAHNVGLCRRVRSALEGSKYSCITPDIATPIVTFMVPDVEALSARLRDANVAASVWGGRLRVSPGIYSTEEDVDRLVAAVLSG